ncbi:Heparan sulfate 6-o-sulfotransferase [Chamberlinius hualienensis]
MELFGPCFSRSGSGARCIVLLCIIFTLGGVIYLGYFCPEKVCALTSVKRQTTTSDVNSQHNEALRPNLKSKDSSISSGGRLSNDQDLLVYDQPEVEYEKEVLNFFQNSDNMPVPYESDSRPKSSKNEPQRQKLRKSSNNLVSYDQIQNSSSYRFDMEANDVMVFLHIQKTGGTTFGRHLVNDLDLDKPCDCRKKGKGQKRRCRCVRPNSLNSYWLFSRFSTGWQCGLHADWTELISCVQSVLDKEEGEHVNRRYFYVTLLREPVIRFLSEFLHVRRGATWKTARHRCGGREAAAEELPSCYSGDNWEDVSMEEFLSCPSNLAINRQTRMLADLTLVGCYNSTVLPADKRDAIMLASAKENLRKLAYFGLCENQHMAQYMFEETFQISFLATFQQFNETHVTSVFKDVTQEQLEEVKRLNHLDIQLYEYARQLLDERFEQQKKSDPHFAERYQMLSQPLAKNAAFPPPEEADSNR